MKIKFIYFDLGGVVFRWSHGIEKITALTKGYIKEIKSVFEKFDYDVCLGKIPTQNIWDKYTNGNTQGVNITHFWSDLFIPITEIYKLIYDHSDKFKLVIITNSYSGVLEQALQKNKVPLADWKSIIQSCVLGLVKPDERIFAYAQQQACIHPNSLL